MVGVPITRLLVFGGRLRVSVYSYLSQWAVLKIHLIPLTLSTFCKMCLCSVFNRKSQPIEHDVIGNFVVAGWFSHDCLEVFLVNSAAQITLIIIHLLCVYIVLCRPFSTLTALHSELRVQLCFEL